MFAAKKGEGCRLSTCRTLERGMLASFRLDFHVSSISRPMVFALLTTQRRTDTRPLPNHRPTRGSERREHDGQNNKPKAKL
ncbi:hypothetical protein PISMIDRAFT_677355 [Pisolithus microcarpus 441]|uniref:Uncharacterized protein n=1 Tax=Pisolithus microcarpus 441 TaxID=765257 RepID=A0A0C9ZGI9_9AGAM|nr:hypothetical protein PISMIDRAFT_677355 [Pisolithus microcarpus 441]